MGTDAPTAARKQGLQPYGALTLFFRWRKKSVQKKASGTATLAARPAMRNSQISAFRALPCPALVFAQACQSLTAFGSCAHWAHAPSRPKLRSAVAPSGLSSTLVRFAHPSGKKASIAHFDGGARNVARNGVGWLTHTGGARSCSPFSAVKMGGPFSLRCLSPPCPGAVGGGHTQPLQGGMLWRSLCFFARQKASGKSNPRWPCLRAMRPVAEWRSESAKRQGAAPDPRAARPVAERR